MLSVNTESGGTVRGSGVFNYGSSVSISAIPFDNYEFVRWEIKNENYSNFQFKTVEVTSDMNITGEVFAKLSNKIYEILQDTEEIAPDWYASSWFGTFFQNESGWSYHYEFGWIFPVIHDSANIWFWHSKLGWVWVNQETFSDNYIWSKDSNNWLYWDNSDISKLRYFNYDNEEWNDWQR